MGTQELSANRRLGTVANHVAPRRAGDDGDGRGDDGTERNDARARPTPSGGAGTLRCVDGRTGKSYDLAISADGCVDAAAFKQIKAGGDGRGLVLYDPGYVNTAPCRSKISYIDGDRGILRYRGYPIETLAESSTYLESAFALVYGDLPNASQLMEWERAIARHSALPVQVVHAIEALPHDAHPMAVMLAGLNSLSSMHPEQNPAIAGGGIYNSHAVQDKQIVRIIGKMTTLAAHAYHRNTGRAPAAPNTRMSYAENFLYMLDAGLDNRHRPHPKLAKAMDVMFLLHAEHEMNCSTAACRHLASSGVDVFCAVAGAVGALYGPLHGGANEAVLKMLERIGNVENIPNFLAGVKEKRYVMFGFGHRVYKNFDPRAKIIRKIANDVFELVGRDPLIDVAIELEKQARADEYFVKRKLYPNVDFYSGLVYRAMGFPPEFFTVLFAIPRATGYLSHWRESLNDPDQKIMRPQQVYQGEWLRDYVPITSRSRSLTDAMEDIQPSNAARRRMAGDPSDAHPWFGNGMEMSTPAWQSGTTVGDATSGVENCLVKNVAAGK
jgi:citrate synthase|tara:strand:+ start:7573 stop:9231 length:1659 start_codon:yes stop_codon:yes gene_type:complete